MRSRPIITLFFFAGALTMLIMSMHYFQHYLTGVLQGKSVSDELWYHVILRVHIIAGIVSMFSGPIQFSKWFRQQYLHLHKQLGYVYVISVFISSSTGLVAAQFAMGGFVSGVGFSVLAILWFCITLLALRYAVKKKVVLHQKWMIRSFALTFSSIPQRLILLLAYTSYFDFLDIYRASAWMSWMLNLAVAQWIIHAMKNSRTT